MKKYKLKQWYPSLDEKWDITHRYEYQSSTGYMCNKSIQHCVIIYKKELHSDFWELIEEEKPLFVTEDGVSIYTNNIELFAVNDMFETASSTRFDFDVSRKEGWKLFYHESNADEYIRRNKRLFSYKDIQNYGVHPVNMIRVEQLAKERSKK